MAKDTTISRWFHGFSTFFRGFTFMNENNLWKYAIVPGIISIGLFFGLIGGLTYVLYSVVENLLGNITEAWGFLGSIIKWFSLFAAITVSFFISIFSYRAVSSILVIPFLGPLLSACEKILTGREVSVSLGQDFKNALLGVWVGIKFFLIEMFFLILSFFTGPVQPIVMGVVEGYFLGRGIFDYILEKHSQTLRERQERAKAFKPEMHGLGTAHFVILLIPIFGPFIAPVSSLSGAALIFFDE